MKRSAESSLWSVDPMRLLLTLQGLNGDCRAGTWPTSIPVLPAV